MNKEVCYRKHEPALQAIAYDLFTCGETSSGQDTIKRLRDELAIVHTQLNERESFIQKEESNMKQIQIEKKELERKNEMQILTMRSLQNDLEHERKSQEMKLDLLLSKERHTIAETIRKEKSKYEDQYNGKSKELQLEYMKDLQKHIAENLELKREIQQLKPYEQKCKETEQKLHLAGYQAKCYERETQDYLESIFGTFATVTDVSQIPHQGDIHLTFYFPCEIHIIIDAKHRKQDSHSRVKQIEFDKFEKDIDHVQPDGAIMFSTITIKRKKGSDDTSNIEYEHRGKTIIAFVSNDQRRALVGAIFRIITDVYCRHKKQELQTKIEGTPHIKTVIMKLLHIIKLFSQSCTSYHNTTGETLKQWFSEHLNVTKDLQNAHTECQKDEMLKDILDVDTLNYFKSLKPPTPPGGTFLTMEEKTKRQTQNKKSNPPSYKTRRWRFANPFMNTTWDATLMSYLIYQNETLPNGTKQQRGYVIFINNHTKDETGLIISKNKINLLQPAQASTDAATISSFKSNELFTYGNIPHVENAKRQLENKQIGNPQPKRQRIDSKDDSKKC